MTRMLGVCLLGCTLSVGCGASVRSLSDDARRDAAGDVAAVLDDWHAAAAAADEARYFDHLADDAVFLGTDATERWTKPAFRAYAHPHFAAGRAWTFRALRRDVTIDPEGRLAWFDEELETEGLGPARGSGVLRFDEGRWRIVHYDLSLTIPNERFAAVHALLTDTPPPMIEGTNIPATPENRAVIAAIERYRAALIARDADAVLATISPRFHDDRGTPDPDDDVDLDGFRRGLHEVLDVVDAVTMSIHYQDVRREADRVLVDVTYELALDADGDVLRREGDRTYVLERDAAGYRLLAGP